MARREFLFTDGSSNKFWSIELKDSSHVVHFGRVGTNGQAQEKTFASADLAKKDHDKLIVEKTKKGYVEVNAGEASHSRPVPVQTAAAPAGAGAKRARNAQVSAAGAGASASAPVESGSEADTPVESASKSSAPSASTAATPVLDLVRRVNITAEDRAKVTWLWQQLPKPPTRSFDYEACVRMAKKWHSSYGYVYAQTAEVPVWMSREEAWFWICVRNAAISGSTWGRSSTRVETVEEWEKMVRKATDGQVPPANPSQNVLIQELLESACSTCNWITALVPFFGSIELAERLMDANLRQIAQAQQAWNRHPSIEMAAEYGDLVLNYESAEVRREFREVMARRFHAESDIQSPSAQLALAFLSLVSGGAELESCLRAGQFVRLRTLAGLPDEATFVSEFNRLKLTLPAPSSYGLDRTLDLARLWLAATEWRHTDALARAIVQGTSKDDAARLARVLALVEAPEAAPSMLEVQLQSKAPTVAAEWLATHPLHTAVGLTPVAMGSGRTAEAARDILQQMRRNGQEAVLSAAAAHLSTEAGNWLQREVIDLREEVLEEASRSDLPSPVAEALNGLKPIKPTAWLQITSLPHIKISGKRLAVADVERLLAALKDTPLAGAEKSSSLPALLKEHADRISLDNFAWRLFDRWLGMGAPSKDKWAMGAIGHFGGDASVLKLTPLVREWPGESQHQRAVYGLEVLSAVGTDTALMSLNGIAQKLKFQGLKEKAKLMMEAIAEARGLTREQLADRIVPDCGLDEHGGRVFDFGPRQFRFVLGPEMKPLVRDAAGKVKSDLPSPNSSDDREKASVAVADWKLLKKTLKEVLKVQAERLEDAMITGRRWTPEEFEMLIVRHPLMVNLARQLVFGNFREDGKAAGTFRITEDQSLADSNDDPCEQPATGSIGVVHPAHLDDATKSAWGQVLSDYEIIPPFQQLGREICQPEPADLDQTAITRYKGPKIPGIVVYGILERSHWLRDKPADGGGFAQHSKYFPSSNVTAFVQYTGMGIGYYEEPQEIESVYFVPGHVKPEWWGDHKNRLKIRDVDPVVISEVLRLVRAIVAKAE